MSLKLPLILFFSMTIGNGFAQKTSISEIQSKLINLHKVNPNDGNYKGFDAFQNVLEGVEIITLGEQSHNDGTTFDTKVKLVQYFHDEMDFDILVFENGFYDCKVAWDKVRDGADTHLEMGKTLFDMWGISMQDRPLFDYISEKAKTDDPLMVLGFDSQFFNKTMDSNFGKELKAFLKTIDPAILTTPEWNHLEATIHSMIHFDFKSLKDQDVASDSLYIKSLIDKVTHLSSGSDSDFWIQTLKNLNCNLSDKVFGENCRDRQMAENLIWIHEQYPDKKIICWGATSHFLYNSTAIRMQGPIIQLLAGNDYKKNPKMGTWLKQKYGDRFYTIGFTAFEGEKGFGTSTPLKYPKKKSLEYLLGKLPYDNFILPFQGMDLSGYISRPLGYFYMKTDLTSVMDGLIFNRTMTPVEADYPLYYSIFPEKKPNENSKAE